MREGSIDAPIRRPIPWKEADYLDEDKLDSELRRVFDICHGCRRCFNLCDSFPRLFDLIDDSPSGEIDTVDSKDFKHIVDACTLCDMCFLTKCPYVPPHEFDLDFPHLMLRYRAKLFKQGRVSWINRRITETDKNGKLGCNFSTVVNSALKEKKFVRPIMGTVLGIHEEAALPTFENQRLTEKAVSQSLKIDSSAPGNGRKVALFATCFSEYNNNKIGMMARAVLAKNGVETEVVYPMCCGMPQLEQGDIDRVASHAEKSSMELIKWIDQGYDIVSLVPSCTLMLKFEWPLILPRNENIKKLSQATFDIAEYIMDISKKEGLSEGMSPIGDITLHISCHSRAQNMGQKGAEMLRQIPDTKVNIIERCSGHGGSWGVMADNFEIALKIGKPVARKVSSELTKNIVSECPLAREHIVQGVQKISEEKPLTINSAQHPIELLAAAYGI